MVESMNQIIDVSKAKHLDLRTAAMLNSINKVAKVWSLNSNVFAALA